MENEEIVDVKFSAYENDYLDFMGWCMKHGCDETELFHAMLGWWKESATWLLEEEL